MTASEDIDDLAQLEQTRSRLETALSRDENWRALRHSGTLAGPGEDTAARRARNTRLEMALADNPFYRAWTHVNEAIAALRERGAAAEAVLDGSVDVPIEAHAVEAAELTPGEPEPPGDAPADTRALGARPGSLADRLAAQGSDAFDLPEDILKLIRANTVDTAEPAPAAAAVTPVPPIAPEQPPAGRTRVIIPSVAAVPAEPRPTPALRSGSTDAGMAALIAARLRKETAQEEASVTFVTREVDATEQGAAHGPQPTTAQVEQLPDAGAALLGDTEAGVPPPSDIEEAEVIILTAEMKEAQRHAEERAGVVRRFRKALSGE